MGVAYWGSDCRKGGEAGGEGGRMAYRAQDTELILQVCQKPLECVEWGSDMISLPFLKVNLTLSFFNI